MDRRQGVRVEEMGRDSGWLLVCKVFRNPCAPDSWPEPKRALAGNRQGVPGRRPDPARTMAAAPTAPGTGNHAPASPLHSSCCCVMGTGCCIRQRALSC